jgi:hypothetical protein
MTRSRRLAAIAGASYLVTHVTSVGAVLLYGPLLTDDSWLAAEGGSGAQVLGALLDVVLAAAVVATGATLLALLRRHAPAASAGYALLRTAEAATILVGAAAVLGVVALRGSGPDGAGAALALRELYSAAFTVGPGLLVGVHTVLLAATLGRLRAIPAWIPVLGVAGAVLVTVSNVAVLAGWQADTSTLRGLAAVPIFAWEIALALTLLIRGLRLGAPGQERQTAPASPRASW